MIPTPHLDKLNAAIVNPKAKDDIGVLQEAKKHYEQWISNTKSLTSTGKERVQEMVSLLNQYKDTFEVELIMKKGSDFLRRQKGQLKLDNSINEEFLVHLIHPKIISSLSEFELISGSQRAFMSLSFRPEGFKSLMESPQIDVKTKDQDFVVGKEIHYKFSTDSNFSDKKTTSGSFILSVLAAECKINLDKTMYQEASATASRLKQGCPVAKYFLVVEYLDMTPEDVRLTAINDVLLLRHARRLPFEKRGNIEDVEKQRKENPIDSEIIWKLVEEIQDFIDNTTLNPDEALQRGSFG